MKTQRLTPLKTTTHWICNSVPKTGQMEIESSVKAYYYTPAQGIRGMMPPLWAPVQTVRTLARGIGYNYCIII